MNNIEIPRDKVLVFRLRGGPRDGQEARSDTPNDFNVNEAIQFWITSRNGTVGHQFGCMSPRFFELIMTKGPREGYKEADGPAELYRYKIVHRQDAESEIVLTCNFEGTGLQTNEP